MSLPLCPVCQSPTKVGTAKRGPYAGNQFLGCSKYPRCRYIWSFVGGSKDANGNREAFTVLSPEDLQAKHPRPGQQGRVSGVTGSVIGWLHRVHRGWLESDEPDGTGKWEPQHRRAVLRYVHDRDGGRCGLCGEKTKLKGAQVEHVVPKVFTTFDIKGGRVVRGSGFRSLLHRLDNLQAAHSYCNKGKSNSPDVQQWRHSEMPPLGIATTLTGSRLMLPAVHEGSVFADRLAATRKAVRWWARRLVGLIVVGSVLLWLVSSSGREAISALSKWMFDRLLGT